MKTAASRVAIPAGGCNYDEFSMNQSLQFSDCLKDLKSLKQQLYSAAEYFESSYSKQDQKQIVMTSLKDYALKAFINTVDHLGSMSHKVNCLLNEKSSELSKIEQPFFCYEQRLKSCQWFKNREGLSQQSLLYNAPHHHKRYIFPDVRGKREEPPTSYIRGQPPPTEHIPELPVEAAYFSFTKTSPNKRSDKRASSPFKLQLSHSGSLANRSASPTTSGSSAKRRYRSPRRSVSASGRPERGKGDELELYASKNKRMFKALLSMRKHKRGGSLYNYLDEH